MFQLQQQVQVYSQAQAVRHIRHRRAQVLTVQLQALKPRQRLLTQSYNRLKKLRHNGSFLPFVKSIKALSKKRDKTVAILRLLSYF